MQDDEAFLLGCDKASCFIDTPYTPKDIEPNNSKNRPTMLRKVSEVITNDSMRLILHLEPFVCLYAVK